MPTEFVSFQSLTEEFLYDQYLNISHCFIALTDCKLNIFFISLLDRNSERRDDHTVSTALYLPTLRVHCK